MKTQNIILHECIQNIKKYPEDSECLIEFNYEIFIYEDGNVKITREANQPLKSGDFVKQILLETNVNKEIYPIIVDYYKDILDNMNNNLPAKYLEDELLQIKDLLEIDHKFLRETNNRIECLSRKNFYYKIENENLKIMNNNYRVDIKNLKNIIEQHKNSHSYEIQQLLTTINKICREL
jgi:hypothetical protein